MTRKEAIKKFDKAKIGDKFFYKPKDSYGKGFREVKGKITEKYVNEWGQRSITFIALEVKNYPSVMVNHEYKIVPDEYFVWFSGDEFKPETSTETSKSGKEIEFSIRKK